MTRETVGRLRIPLLSFILLQAFGVDGPARAEHRARPARRAAVTRARPVYPTNAPAPSSTLGTFQPATSIMVRGNFPFGAGYSPLDIYGDQTMVLYGPFSSLRSSTAPVYGYTRGYDGQVRVVEGISSSTPNLPILSPVVYPTENNYYYAPRVRPSPPWESFGINWIDEN